MHVKRSNTATKVLIAIAFILTANQTVARPTTDELSICYGIDKNDNESFKTPCIVSYAGGAGVHIVTYQIKEKEYSIEMSDGYNELNGQPYESYIRDIFFNRVSSPVEDDYSFYCYKSKQAHFCSKLSL